MSLRTSYHPNYYSIDDILATQERVPCRFLQNVPKMGRDEVIQNLYMPINNPNFTLYVNQLNLNSSTAIKKCVLKGKLNPSTDEADLKAGTELELPLWLTLECSAGRQPIGLPELPKIYKEAYREILKADATALDLHKFNLYFYELGSYVKHFDRRGDVHDILLHTFTTRFRLIMDLAHNSECDPTIQQKLDILERRIFRDGHNARMKLNDWLLESGVPLQAANMVTNHRKRKRVNDDLFS